MSHDLPIVYAVLGVAAVVLALLSASLRDLPVSAPLVALVLGVAIGPHGPGWVTVEPATADALLLEGTRFLLALSVMTAALRYPASALRPVLRGAVVLLVVAMPVAAVVAGAAAALLGLPIALAAVVGACLSPTDPVLASSVVTGEPAERDLPARLRRMLTIESGANDGLALPLVGLAIAVALPGEGVGGALPGLLVEVVLGVVVGAVLGATAGWGLAAARRHGDLEPGPQMVLTALVAIATLGVVRVLGGAAVLAAFAAGNAYNVVLTAAGDDDGVAQSRADQDQVDEAINRYAVLPVFVLLGVVLPWEDWVAFGPAALAFVGAVLLLRRLPVVLALGRALPLSGRQAAFAGWFGPMGVSALFYLAHARHEGVDDPRVFAAGMLAVTASVVASALTSSPLRAAYARSGGGT